MRRLLPILLLFVGGIIGFSLNQWHHSSDKKPDAKITAMASAPDTTVPNARPPLQLDQIKSRLATALQRGYIREDRHWHELLDSITAAEMPSLIAMVQSSDLNGKFGFLHELYNRWGRLDPAAAIPSVQNASPDHEGRRRSLVSSALNGWAYTDVRAMAEWTLQLQHGQLRQDAVGAMCKFPSDLDLATIIRIAGEELNANSAQSMFRVWAERDPAAAAEEAENSPPGPAREGRIRAVVQTWVRQDPVRATNWFIGLDHSFEQPRMNNFLYSVSAQYPSLAASALDKLPAGYGRLTHSKNVLSNWGKTDPNAAFAWLTPKPLNAGSIELYASLGSAVGSHDLDLAKQMASKLSNSAVQKAFLDSALRGFAHADPAAAWDTVNKLEPGEFKDKLVKGAITKLGETDPVGALKRLSDLSDGYGDARFATGLITKIGEDDLAAAIEYVQLLPTVESRDNALLQLISNHGNGNFAESAIIASAISPGPAATEAITRIAGSYAAYQPEAALSWLDSLPQNAAKDAATVAMLGPVYMTDPSTGMTLALSLPAGKHRESAISSVASMWNQVDAYEAIAWAKTLSGADRAAALGTLTKSWLSLEPEQATEFLSNLSAEDLSSQFLQNTALNLVNSPKMATQMIDNLPESDLRQSALETVVKNWLVAGSRSFQWQSHPLRIWQSIEPGQATAWINKSDLPAETKDELLHIVAGGTLPIK